MKDVSKRSNCRLCHGDQLEGAFELAPTPPANELLRKNQLTDDQETFPLDVIRCKRCGHVQLAHVVDPERLFRNYVYVSGTSPIFVEHFRQYAEEATRTAEPAVDSLVVDIGSNDGTLLRFYKEAGHRILGVDPAREISQRATDSGIPTDCRFFTAAYAKEVLGRHGPATIVTANNVFAHADDLRDITCGVSLLLKRDGIFVFEVSYLLDVLQNNLFDTIYHEHVSYHSVKPLASFLNSLGLRLFKVSRVHTHGGSIRCFATKSSALFPLEPSVHDLIQEEISNGLYEQNTYRGYIKNIVRMGKSLNELLHRLKSDKKKIAGFGAPAKATTLMHQFDIGQQEIDYIVDDSPLKQGLFSPGKKIPIVDSDILRDQSAMPDYLLILAWNFSESIIRNNAFFSKAGGKFLVPIPELKVV
ncbi:MAG: class I SAM-dependent methyltransferase [Bacteroidota bacterium]|nr:class I SAM-dependent methyltransferase [Bacteroidota bacterium]